MSHEPEYLKGCELIKVKVRVPPEWTTALCIQHTLMFVRVVQIQGGVIDHETYYVIRLGCSHSLVPIRRAIRALNMFLGMLWQLYPELTFKMDLC